MCCVAHEHSACVKLAISWGFGGRGMPPNGVWGEASKALAFLVLKGPTLPSPGGILLKKSSWKLSSFHDYLAKNCFWGIRWRSNHIKDKSEETWYFSSKLSNHCKKISLTFYTHKELNIFHFPILQRILSIFTLFRTIDISFLMRGVNSNNIRK